MAQGSAFPAFISVELDPNSNGFREFREQASGAGDAVKKQFEADMADVQRVIRNALTLPPNANGTLNIDTSSMRQAAVEADRTAQATREFARAAEEAARANGDNSEATRRYVVAAQAAAREAEDQARSLNMQAASYEKLQAEINRTGTQLQTFASANQKAASSQRIMGQASAQMGQQVQDVVISLVSGQRAGIVFAQQIPQMTYAMTQFGGRVGAVATALSGPFASVALVAASFGLGRLLEKLFGAEDASKKSQKAVETFSDSIDRQKHSLEEVNKALADYYAAKERAREIDIQSAEAAARETKRRLENAIAIRKETQAILDSLDASILSGRGFGIEGAGAAAAGRNALQAKLDANATELGRLVKEAEGAVVDVAENIAKLQSDTVAQLKTGFDLMRKEARASIKDVDALTRRLVEINRQEKVATDAARKAERNSRRDGGASPSGELTRFFSPVTGGRITSTPGIRRDPVTGKTAQHNGVDIAVPIGTSVRAPSGGTIIESGILPGYGNVVFIDHGAGTITRLAHLSKRNVQKGDVVERGDIIGLSGNSGKSTGPHLHWETRVNNRVVDPRGRQLPTDPLGAAQRSERLMEQARRAAEQLQREIDRSSESVSRLRGQFDEAPRDVDRATAAVIDLNKAIAEAEEKLKTGGLSPAQKKVVETTRDAAIEVRDQVIPDFLKRPIKRELTGMEDELRLQSLLVSGRRADYEVMQDQVDLARMLGAESLDDLNTQIEKRGISKEMVDIYYRQRAALRAQNLELEKQQEQQQILLQTVDDIQSAAKGAIYDFFDGRGLNSAKRFISSLMDITRRQLTEEVFVKIFGDTFRNQRLKILGLDQVDKTGKAMASAIRVTINPIRDLGNAAAEAARKIALSAANDNGPASVLGLKAGGKTSGAIPFGEDIVVNGFRSIDNMASELKGLHKTTSEGLGKNGGLAKVFGGFGEALSGALRGAAIGDATSGVLKSLGVKQSRTGAQIGGAIGSFLPIPGGEIIGSIIGGTIGGLFKKTPKGSATITGVDNDPTYVGSGKLRAGVTGMAGGVQEQLSRIADALGGDIGSFAVSIGQRKKSFVVDPTGRGRTKGAGVQKYASEEEAALAALRDAILDGAVKGISAGAQRLLRAGKDLDKQLQKAIDFQGVFDRLAEHDNPVKAALDRLDREFGRLKGIFAEAGASAAEFADLERLYGIERAAAIKEASERVASSLKGLYNDLILGDNGRSLRDRLSAAQASYDPLKARVLAGDTSAYDDFAQAARSLLDIQRQFSGSQTPYFNLLDEITRITKERIDAETNITSLAINRDTPFGPNGQATGANDNAAVVGAINKQTGELITGFETALAGLARQLTFENVRMVDQSFRFADFR